MTVARTSEGRVVERIDIGNVAQAVADMVYVAMGTKTPLKIRVCPHIRYCGHVAENLARGDIDPLEAKYYRQGICEAHHSVCELNRVPMQD